MEERPGEKKSSTKVTNSEQDLVPTISFLGFYCKAKPFKVVQKYCLTLPPSANTNLNLVLFSSVFPPFLEHVPILMNKKASN